MLTSHALVMEADKAKLEALDRNRLEAEVAVEAAEVAGANVETARDAAKAADLTARHEVKRWTETAEALTKALAEMEERYRAFAAEAEVAEMEPQPVAAEAEAGSSSENPLCCSDDDE